MAIRQSGLHCKGCLKNTLHQRRVFSIGWGIFLTLVTSGFFLPVWGIIAVVGIDNMWICQTCGRERTKSG